MKGQRVRVALAWSSHTSGTSNLGKTDVLRADLDLVDPPAERDDDGIVLVRQLLRGRRRDRVEQRDDAHHRASTIASTPRRSRSAWPGHSPAPSPTSRARSTTARSSGSPQRSIMAGCTSTRFCPGGSLTRGQLAKALAEGLDLPATSTDFYSDDENSRIRGRHQPPHRGRPDRRLWRRQILPRRSGTPRTAGHCPGPRTRPAGRQPRLFQRRRSQPARGQHQPHRRRRHQQRLRWRRLLPRRPRQAGTGRCLPAQRLRLGR